MGSLELLRFQRIVAGFPVESDTLDVLVTNETAPLGPGIVPLQTIGEDSV